MAESMVKIYDIMACNVYMDFENSVLRKEQHKFLVSFYPTGGAPLPEMIERITALGPDGYKVPFRNQEFSAANRNGWIFDRTTNGYWYMVNLDTGFMKEGRYTIEVQCKDGSVKTMSRQQESGPGRALVGAYLKSRDAVLASYSPSIVHPFVPGSPRSNVEVSWKSLKELADQDAFYIYRLSEGRSGKEFNTQQLVWWDNIFVQRATNPEAGCNRNRVVLGAELKAGTPYVYFVEITDSNAMGRTNMCIFQPHQMFTA